MFRPFSFQILPSAWAALLLSLVFMPVLAMAATSLGRYPQGGDYTGAAAVSGDGSILAGVWVDASSNYYAVSWLTSTGAMTNLGNLGTTDYNLAISMSDDGSVIVGVSTAVGGAFKAFRWTAGGGMVNLGTLGGLEAVANGTSSDGSVVVGWADNAGGNPFAFRWTAGGGMANLGSLGTVSYANAVSGDGTVVVGEYRDAIANSFAFRWTAGGGMADLGGLGGGTSTIAYGISDDGTVIVGQSDLAGGAVHAFRWTAGGGMVDLGTVPGGGVNSLAYDVSGDGSIVVGGSGTQAFRWTAATGMQNLNTLLSAEGVDMTGITLLWAGGISDDGNYMSATGDYLGLTQAFMVSLSSGGAGGGGVTTPQAQAASLSSLAENQQSAMAASRATSNVLLGFTRPVNSTSYRYTGGMVGSALGYTGAQYTRDRLTMLGGVGIGQQDYTDIDQNTGVTLAGALRYRLSEAPPVIGGAPQPYAEAGVSVSPRVHTTFSRTYANGAGSATGKGKTEVSNYLGYVRGGMQWQLSAEDQLVAYGDLGAQSMVFDGYTESSNANPFPATVGSGAVTFGVLRAGTAWTHDLGSPVGEMPLSFTLAGSVAQSFAPHSDISAAVAGAGTVHAADQTTHWAEFGARVEAGLSDNLSLDVDLSGTSSQGERGADLHGGLGLAYRF